MVWFEQAQAGPCQSGDDNYDIDDIVVKMLRLRDRKIPGSVYKPHNETVLLIQSSALG